MVSMLVFAVAALTMMGVYVGISQIAESSRNLLQAMGDVRTVLEAMRNTANSNGLGRVTDTDWTQWADDYLTQRAEDNDQLPLLGNETITVNYTDEAADPLEVNVQVDWTERGRARSATIDTLMTQR